MTDQPRRGPWRIFVEDDDGPSKLPGTFTVDDKTNAWIAQGIESEASARLIAAAPAMLDALRALLLTQETGRCTTEWQDAERVVAQATGIGQHIDVRA